MDNGDVNMTPEELTIFFMHHGFHLKMKSWITNEKTKYKLAKNSLQKFINDGESGWLKVSSIYYKDIELNPETNKLKYKKKII